MKYFLLFSLIISSSSYSVAVVGDPAKCDACKPLLSGAAKSALPADYKKVARDVAGAPSPNIESLAYFICDAYKGPDPVSRIKRAIYNHMASDPDYKDYPNPSNGVILKFLNRNRNYMTCGDGRNYMMVAFDNGTAFRALFDDLLIGEFGDDGEFKDGVKISFNAFSYTGPEGKPETLLDYMERIKKDPAFKRYKDEIGELIADFRKNFGAVNYLDL